MRYFEYHCWEDPRSSDAEAWYRSHEPVTVVAEVEPPNDDHAGVYRVRWEDGFEYDAWGDELVADPGEYTRPASPRRP